jgi:hypothetical protein
MKQTLLIIMLFLIAACAPQPVAPAKGKIKNFGISLEAKPNQGEVKILTKAQGFGNAGEKNGFVGFDQGESGGLLFMVKKEDLSATCADTAEWVITQVALTAFKDKNSDKGDDKTFDKPQPAWMKEAFPAIDPDKNGYVLNVDKKDAQTFAIVQNDNAQEGERTIYYRVTLTPCDDQGGQLQPLQTDPAIRNGGRRV